MNGRQQRHVQTLKRRRDRLAERVSGYRADGDPNRAKGELAALNYAIRLIEAADASDVLTELEMIA